MASRQKGLVCSHRYQIRVRQGKGNKDRYMVLAEKAFDLLQIYYQKFEPVDWLFPGKEPDSRISPNTARAE